MSEEEWEEMNPNNCIDAIMEQDSGAVYCNGEVTFEGNRYKFDDFKVKL